MAKHLDSNGVPVNTAARLAAGDRRALARAITLVESTRSEDQAAAERLLTELLPRTGRAIRIGISGAPGVGKSTFIESFGRHLTGLGKRVAVFAIDPSSRRSGGSILGDKTRMEQLSRDPNAYIRPSPAGTTLGGVARRTRESMLLAEAAGFDVVVVETVGVGQSETAVADMTDFFLVLMLPGAGDELQGLKKGVVEIADMIAVNKADGDNVARAKAAAAEYRAALHILQAPAATWTPPVVTYSALTGEGIAGLWEAILDHRAKLTKSGEFAAKRSAQQVRWLRDMLQERLFARLRGEAKVKSRVNKIEAAVAAGRLSPMVAVEEIAEILKL